MTHATKESGGWKHEVEFRHKLHNGMLSRQPYAEDARELADIEFQLAAIGCAFPEFRSEAAPALSEGAAAGAASVLVQARHEGHIVLSWSDTEERAIPAAPIGANPVTWLRAIGCALAVRDNDALEILCYPPHIAAAHGPEHLWDPFWPFLCTAAAALVRQPDTVAQWASQVEPLLAPDTIVAANPAAVEAQYAPLLCVIREIAMPSGHLAKAAASALDAYKRYWDGVDAPWNPMRLVSLELLGLLSLAHDRGLAADVPGLPDDIIAGRFERRTVGVRVQYAPRAAKDSADAIGFLDLEGFPRRGRDHVLVERAGGLIAAYRMGPAPGIPNAGIDFILNESTQPSALDAAESVMWASWCAEVAGRVLNNDDRKSARALLSQAVEAVDLVLSEIPPGKDSVPPELIVNARGKRYFEGEPGRFRRERLAAYRDSLARQRDELTGPGFPAQTSVDAADAAHRQSALVSAEVIKAVLLPLLAALRTDSTGTVSHALRPRPEDYAKVFARPAIETARSFYERAWQDGPAIEAEPSQTQVIAHVCPGGMFLSDNELSRPFPAGYRTIAEKLTPHAVWACWKYVRPGETSGMAYDGLVWCDDHWSWFPKPYRALDG